MLLVHSSSRRVGIRLKLVGPKNRVLASPAFWYPSHGLYRQGYGSTLASCRLHVHPTCYLKLSLPIEHSNSSMDVRWNGSKESRENIAALGTIPARDDSPGLCILARMIRTTPEMVGNEHLLLLLLELKSRYSKEGSKWIADCCRHCLREWRRRVRCTYTARADIKGGAVLVRRVHTVISDGFLIQEESRTTP